MHEIIVAAMAAIALVAVTSTVDVDETGASGRGHQVMSEKHGGRAEHAGSASSGTSQTDTDAFPVSNNRKS